MKLLAVLALLFPLQASAALITFNFQASVQTVNANGTTTITQDETPTSYYTSFGNTVTSSGTGFGVDVLDMSCDSPGLIDGGCALVNSPSCAQFPGTGCGGEVISFGFLDPVIVKSVQVSGFDQDDVGIVNFQGPPPAFDILNDGLTLLPDVPLDIGRVFYVGWIAGSGFSLDAITIETVEPLVLMTRMAFFQEPIEDPTSVPEPATLLLLGAGLPLLWRRRLK